MWGRRLGERKKVIVLLIPVLGLMRSTVALFFLVAAHFNTPRGISETIGILGSALSKIVTSSCATEAANK